MVNLKFYILIAMILFILSSASLTGYVHYGMATAKDYAFKSDDKANKPADYVVLKDIDSRGVSAPAFWQANKYFIIAPHVLNFSAMVAGAYLIYSN